jgi:hypothetical protein
METRGNILTLPGNYGLFTDSDTQHSDTEICCYNLPVLDTCNQAIQLLFAPIAARSSARLALPLMNEGST